MVQHTTSLPETGFIRLPDVLHFTGFRRTTWLNGVKDGTLPQPIKLTERTVAWRVEDIHSLIAELSVKSKGANNDAT